MTKDEYVELTFDRLGVAPGTEARWMLFQGVRGYFDKGVSLDDCVSRLQESGRMSHSDRQWARDITNK